MKFLAEQYFLHFCVPLIAVGLSVFLKYVSRNDKHKAFQKEDLAVGLDISVTALILFITYSADMARKSLIATASIPNDKLAAIPWIIAMFIIGIWCVSTIVRKLGWEDENKLWVFWGIILPDIFGIVTLIFIVNWIS